MFLIKVLIMLFSLQIPNIGIAQSYPIYKNNSAIAVLDQDSLFTDSNWGKKILQEVESKVKELAAENRSIEKELELEELELSEKRKIIKKLEFDLLAFEFDSKVKKIRENQAKKQRKINYFLNENRSKFFKMITPLLLSLIDELGVEVLLNKDTVALASTGSDITKLTIDRINKQLEK